jgi:hypothetical protein
LPSVLLQAAIAISIAPASFATTPHEREPLLG